MTMIRAWIKSKLPRSLFGRAMLILAVPIIVIQIVVATYFAERLFRDVSEQMSSNIALEINYLVSLANQSPDRATALLLVAKAARPLNMNAGFQNHVSRQNNGWLWFDLSGRYVTSSL